MVSVSGQTDSTRVINRKIDSLALSLSRKHNSSLPQGWQDWDDTVKISWCLAQVFSHQKYRGKGVNLKVHQLDERPGLLGGELT